MYPAAADFDLVKPGINTFHGVLSMTMILPNLYRVLFVYGE